MGTAIIKAKLAQQLTYLKLMPFYGVFLDLQKAFDAMDRERCTLIMEGYGAGPRLIRLVQTYWWDAIMVCWASGYYSAAFKAEWCYPRGTSIGQTIQHLGQCGRAGVDLTTAGGWGL